ncbi:MAG: hypothetical protein Q4P15_09815 [Propionibacteriaceae bacterium]|nr:hypothetical protein [Propionibacteriaceae bacterium]
MTEKKPRGGGANHPGPGFTYEAPDPPRRPQGRRRRTAGVLKQQPRPAEQPTVASRLRGKWLLGALVVLGVGVATAFALLSAPGPRGDERQDPLPSVATTRPRSGVAIIPHNNGGAFLSPLYARGVRDFRVVGEGYGEMVGTSSDLKVVAILVGEELRGIDMETTQTLWTYPSFSCSQGSWDGVALCVDEDDSSAVYREGVRDVVGLDLSTGQEVFRFTPDGVPENFVFIGSDESHGYFTLGIHQEEGYTSFGQQHVVALDPAGAVVWMTPIDTDGMIYRAALTVNDRMILDIEDTIFVLERTSGSIVVKEVFNETGGLQLLSLLWDGWLAAAPEGENHYKVFDLDGTLVDELGYVDEFIPSSLSVGGTATTVYGSESLDSGGQNKWEVWAVTATGERVVGSVGGRIVDTHGRHLAASGRLTGISADGSLFLSDRNNASIHDAKTGKPLGGFAASDSANFVYMVDGIVFQKLSGTSGTGIALLLPGKP